MTFYHGNNHWDYKSKNLIPNFPVPLFDADKTEHKEFTDKENEWRKNLKYDSLQCMHCGAETKALDAPMIMQTMFKSTPTSFLEEIQRNVKVSLEKARHIVLLGYRLPPDDTIWQQAFAEAVRSKLGTKSEAYCSVVVGHRGEQRWLYDDELTDYVNTHQKDVDVASLGVDAIENAIAIFGKKKVRAWTGGIPQVFGSCTEYNVNALLYPEWVERNKVGKIIMDEDEKTPLMLAIDNNSVQEVKRLIAEGADVNEISNYNKHTALTLLTQKSLREYSPDVLEMAKLLIEAGADVNAKGTNRSPLERMVSRRYHNINIDMARLLIQAGADIDDDMIESAIWNKLYDIVSLLLQHITKLSKDTEILYFFYKDDVTKLQEIIKNGFDITTLHINNFSPLMLSARFNSYKILKFLISIGMNLNEIGETSETLLGYASYENSIEVVQVLLENGIDVNIRDGYGNTPLLKATSYWRHGSRYCEDNYAMVKLLIENGADVNAKNDWSWPPLRETNSAKIAKILIDNGADLNARVSEGNTVFMHKLEFEEQLEIPELLIEYGADINAKNNKGETALLFIFSHDDYTLDKIKFLVNNGIDLNAKDFEGKDAIMKISERLSFPYNKKLSKELLSNAELLIEAGINAEPDNLLFLIKSALEYDSVKIIEYLIEKGLNIDNREILIIRKLVFDSYSSKHKLFLEGQLRGSMFKMKNGFFHDDDMKVKERIEDLWLESIVRKYPIPVKEEFVYRIFPAEGQPCVWMRKGYTLLTIACVLNHKDMAKMLIKKGADISVVLKDAAKCKYRGQIGLNDVIPTLNSIGVDLSEYTDIITSAK